MPAVRARDHPRRRTAGSPAFAAVLSTEVCRCLRAGDVPARRKETIVQNRGMDVPRLLEAASLLVPDEAATENDITVNDIWEYLTHDEWEVALGLLEELSDAHPLPLGFWQALATAAEQLRQPVCEWLG